MQPASKRTGMAWGIGATAMALVIVTAPAAAAASGPEELRGKVVSVAGDRIRIALDQTDWLPRARGTKVSLGAEMAGMFVPLKGSFAVVQVNADSVIAMEVGGGERGTPAAGMLAVIRTLYPNQPQLRADYLAVSDAEAAVLAMAEGGDPLAQHTLAGACELKGDHDNALLWWQRAVQGNAPATVIARSAMGIADILENRRDFRAAAGALEDAVARTAPRESERTFEAYCAPVSSVRVHLDLLDRLGGIHRSALNDLEQSKRWHRAAADLMSAVARSGAPGPDHPNHWKFRALLNDLVLLHTHALQDPDAALPWLQMAARHGDFDARKTLTERGLRW
jgi:TPR repeat protein